LIDDDPDFSEACANFLAAAGYDTARENDDQRALDKIREYSPDLVLLDVVMSQEASGFQIAAAMNEDSGLRNVPVIFLTGYFKKARLSPQEDQAIKNWTNIKAVLDKPVKPAQLLEAIRNVMVDGR
jgi:CheY-like chemotaxis protein